MGLGLALGAVAITAGYLESTSFGPRLAAASKEIADKKKEAAVVAGVNPDILFHIGKRIGVAEPYNGGIPFLDGLYSRVLPRQCREVSYNQRLIAECDVIREAQDRVPAYNTAITDSRVSVLEIAAIEANSDGIIASLAALAAGGGSVYFLRGVPSRIRNALTRSNPHLRSA